ncbi:hypothetical protein L593_06905 [Salinarchaeum sp. Harcht-Bsk1]|uniref:hypothetical protein n=1 Tax=Salinarchaeum sp. Harcht-Bsk1 TaxID=1333523 RepID=UPI0003423BAE|nr:hypothetical protein [Salinarchaeum sp. Harcht-Bsk1]AGN01328.1 hypothetical protein L593_06905 [Salinarchaeum sp. Harcht-Bsk1]
MDADWEGVSRTGKATVTGGALVALGTVLPYMSYSGGSASLLQDGKMEVVLSNGMSAGTATVASSETFLFALVLAAIAIGLPLLRGWDWKSSLPVFLVGAFDALLFGYSALMLHGGDQDAALVGGEPVAASATPGIGLYAAIAGTLVVTVLSLGNLLSTVLGRLRG